MLTKVHIFGSTVNTPVIHGCFVQQYFQNFLVIINTYFAEASIVCCCYAIYTLHQHLVSHRSGGGHIGPGGVQLGPVGV